MTLSAKGDGKCLLNSRWVSGRGLAVYSQWNVDRQLTVSPELKGKETCHMTGTYIITTLQIILIHRTRQHFNVYSRLVLYGKNSKIID